MYVRTAHHIEFVHWLLSGVAIFILGKLNAMMKVQIVWGLLKMFIVNLVH